MSILYVCDQCQDSCPEACGRPSPDELRVLPTGDWVCEDCYDNTQADRLEWDEHDEAKDQPKWFSLPMPPEYVPLVKIEAR